MGVCCLILLGRVFIFSYKVYKSNKAEEEEEWSIYLSRPGTLRYFARDYSIDQLAAAANGSFSVIFSGKLTKWKPTTTSEITDQC